MRESAPVALEFTCDFDERTQWEVRQKGWFDQVLAELPDGSKVRLSFWDPVRLVQDFHTDIKHGKACLAEPNMVVIPEMTIENMQAAVDELYRVGYFDKSREPFGDGSQ